MKSIVYLLRAWLVVLSLFSLSACGLDDPPSTAPVISGAPATAITEDSAYADASISATDEDGDSISYSITGPAWLNIDPNTGALNGTPLNADVGANDFTITATDAKGDTDTLALTITVANTNDTPVVISTIPDQIVANGFAAYDLDLSTYFSDIDVGDTAIFSVTSNSDSTTIGISVAGSILTLSHLLSNSNVISITVRITDGSAAFVEDTFTVNFPPVYYTTGFYWNDYVKNDGVDRFSASDTACDGMETGGYDACIHGGEVRFFDSGLTDACSGLTAADVLGAFDWVCDDSGATTVFYSSDLADGKKLSDLIDFTAAPIDWKSNQLVVTGGVGFTSISMKWWDNPIVEDNDGMAVGEAIAGTIYVVTVDPQAIYVIDQSNVGLVIKPGVTLTGTAATGESLIEANSQNFLWLEGDLDVAGDTYGIILTSKFAVLRGVTSDSGNFGVVLNSSVNNNLSGITTTNNSDTGVFLTASSDNNMLSNVSVYNSKFGIRINSSSSNMLSGVTSSNVSYGVYMHNFSRDNSLSEVRLHSNLQVGVTVLTADGSRLSDVITNGGRIGINISNSNDTTLTGITTSSIAGAGIEVNTSSNNILLGVTAANVVPGIYLKFTSESTLSVVSAVNNGVGINFFSSANNMLSDMAIANNNVYGILLSLSSNNAFSGLLKVGNNALGDCYVIAESTSIGGLKDDAGSVDATHDGLCLQVAPSDFGTATTGVSLASSFVGKVTTDDSNNADDTNGKASDPADITVFDWSNFDNVFRGWGLDGSAFPNADHVSKWFLGTGRSGRIWDWSLKSSDTVIRNVLALPTGNDTLTHTWSDASTTTFLRNAVEISDDGVGDDNLLCESNEECLYMPNMGSYQGHGALISAGVFVDGTITGVTLWKYTTNGY